MVDTFVVVVGTILVVETIGFGLYACVWPETRRQRLVWDFAAKRGLMLDAEATSLAERLLVASQRGRFLGASLGMAAMFGTWSATRSLAVGVSPGGAVWASFALCYVIPQVTGTFGAAFAGRRAAPDARDHRVAHLPAPSLGDYLPPLMRWSSAALLAASGVAVGTAILTWPSMEPTVPSIGRRSLAATWLACLVAVAATEVAARVVVRMPRPARSPAALAVQDEITGNLLVVVIHGVLGPGLVLGLLASAIGPAALMVGCWAVAVPALAEHRRRRRVRQQLWRVTPATGPTVSPHVAPEAAP